AVPVVDRALVAAGGEDARLVVAGDGEPRAVQTAERLIEPGLRGIDWRRARRRLAGLLWVERRSGDTEQHKASRTVKRLSREAALVWQIRFYSGAVNIYRLTSTCRSNHATISVFISGRYSWPVPL